MADKQFSIDTDVVLKSVGVLQTKTQSFSSETKKLYSETESLSVEWKGQTSAAFNSDLQAYQETINEMCSLLEQFTNAINTAVGTYTSADDEMAGLVKNIRAGR